MKEGAPSFLWLLCVQLDWYSAICCQRKSGNNREPVKMTHSSKSSLMMIKMADVSARLLKITAIIQSFSSTISTHKILIYTQVFHPIHSNGKYGKNLDLQTISSREMVSLFPASSHCCFVPCLVTGSRLENGLFSPSSASCPRYFFVCSPIGCFVFVVLSWDTDFSHLVIKRFYIRLQS